MKTSLKTLSICLLATIAIVSCKDKNDDGMDDYYKQVEREELMIDSTLNAQSIDITEYVNLNLTGAKEDTVNVPYGIIDKITKRGIWYRIESEPTDNTYEYKVNATGTSLVYPKMKLKYTAKLLNGTVVESDVAGSDYNLSISSPKITRIWTYAFFPYNIQFNGEPRKPFGLTKDGLKKGSKITVVTPSLWAYGTKAQTGIPANSPLVYEFEVLTIE